MYVLLLQEVNVPRHVARYSDLVSVDVSEESFQKLTVRLRKREHCEPKRRSAGQAEKPDIMDWYPFTASTDTDSKS